MTSRERADQGRSPETPLGQRLAEIRGRIKASGQPLLSWRDIDRKLARGRDGEGPIEEIVARIVAGFDPLRVILFGSHACGEAGYDSDVDLLVVFDNVAREDRRGVAVEIRRALAEAPVPKDIFVTDADEIERRGHLVGTVLREALREGRVLYERT